jgi:Xaa-Pro aminopeptidase
MTPVTPPPLPPPSASIVKCPQLTPSLPCSYPPIVAAGAHASTLHYTSENGVAAAGDLLVRVLIESNCTIKNFFNHTYATKHLTALQLVDAAAQVLQHLLSARCPLAASATDVVSVAVTSLSGVGLLFRHHQNFSCWGCHER